MSCTLYLLSTWFNDDKSKKTRSSPSALIKRLTIKSSILSRTMSCQSIVKLDSGNHSSESKFRIATANLDRSSIADMDSKGQLTVHEQFRNFFLWSCVSYDGMQILFPKDKNVMITMDLQLLCTLPAVIQVYSYKGQADFVRHPVVLEGTLYMINTLGQLIGCNIEKSMDQIVGEEPSPDSDLTFKVCSQVQDFCVNRKRKALYYMTYNGSVFVSRGGESACVIESPSNDYRRDWIASIDNYLVISSNDSINLHRANGKLLAWRKSNLRDICYLKTFKLRILNLLAITNLTGSFAICYIGSRGIVDIHSQQSIDKEMIVIRHIGVSRDGPSRVDVFVGGRTILVKFTLAI